MAASPDKTPRAIIAGLLTWLVPGVGHYWLGHRGLAAVFFIAISFPYFTGLALGGLKESVNPRSNVWLFAAEMGVGGYTLPGALISRQIENYIDRQRAAGHEVDLTDYVAYYPESDVAQIYLATAGLLNVLAILDAIARAQTGGLPTFHRHLDPNTEAAEND